MNWEWNAGKKSAHSFGCVHVHNTPLKPNQNMVPSAAHFSQYPSKEQPEKLSEGHMWINEGDEGVGTFSHMFREADEKPAEGDGLSLLTVSHL